MAKKQLYLCVDRPVPPQHEIEASRLAIKESRLNEPPPLALGPGAVLHPVKIAIFTGKMWDNRTKRTLGVKFLDGSKKQKAQTQKYASVWSRYANVTFDFNAGANAEIRISFRFDTGSWSALGVDAIVRAAFPKSEPTMNFGWLRDDTPEEEWRRVVLHEFGHALGAIHEHQNPRGGLQWNLPAVYKAFSGPPNNWSKAEIDFNIVQKYSVDQLNATEFDARSIMLYAFPAELLKSHVPTRNNTDLSERDKSFIAERYPKQPAASETHPMNAAGTPRISIAAPKPRFATVAGVAGLRAAAAPRRRAR